MGSEGGEAASVGVVLITGSEGNIGRVLQRGLTVNGGTLRLFDRCVGSESTDDNLVVGDLTDFEAVEAVMDGVDTVIHLAGIPEEAPFGELIEDNIRGTYHVFEAARRRGVRRVVFASTNHVVGFYPSSEVIDDRAVPRPDTLYGVSKAFGEALGRLYHDKFGLEVVSVRIGSFRAEPGSHRELATWLSHDDAIRLFTACITAPRVRYLVVYGVSANTRSHWRDAGATTIGYQPRDDAEVFASLVPPPGPHDHLHGGAYTDPGHMGGF
jgi:uronate dehydrogenase